MIEIRPNLADGFEIEAEDFDQIIAAQESPRAPTQAIIEATRRWHALLAEQNAAASLARASRLFGDDPIFTRKEFLI